MVDLTDILLPQRQAVSKPAAGIREAFRAKATEESSIRQNKIKIIFVAAGGGRSGKTLLSRLVGEMDGCINVGELRELMNGLAENNGVPCGCGSVLTACLLWKNTKSIIPSNVQEYTKRRIRMRWFPLFLLRLIAGTPTGEFRKYLQTLETIYNEITRWAGCSVIVDSSTSPTYLSTLIHLPNVEIYLLHIVRSPQAVAMSWSRKKNYLARQSQWKSLIAWSVENACYEWLGRWTDWYQRIRYEDFVNKPQEILRSVTEGILERPVKLPFINMNRALFHVQHHLAGNPDKLTSGETVIRGDTAIPAPLGTRILTHLLTFPLLWHYGYL